ncbi:hypothetical protein DN398_25350 [Bacillus sp. JAS102]|uniref:hypothetical protein n=1 Tax=Bacillus sp. JAS102 TaxID=2217824 RepID=UPI0011EEE239|nr:hypothetical protein [Bacillus sp. JAS102]KAA0796725.1 hypothetical protein DN398_25350 [Bacillus sp. JAS102]
MKKLLMSFSILLIATLLFGCSNETFDKAVEKGKLALANKEYANASASFEIALKEKKDEEVQILQKQASKMEVALDEKEKLEIDNAIKLFNQVATMKDGLETVKNEAKKERETLTQYKDKRENYNKELQIAQDLLSEKKFDESKVILTKIQQETTSDKMLREQNQKVIEQLEKLEKEKNAAAEEEKRQEEQKKAAEKKKQQAKEQQAKEQQAKEQQAKEQQVKEQTTQSSKQKLSPTDAENKVRNTLNLTNNSNVYCEYEGGEGEVDEYVIHVYTIVLYEDNEEGGHTVTYGWYNVNANTGEVHKME